MTSTLNVIPKDRDLHTGVKNADEVAGGLRGVLADTYALISKTQGCHWNVEGPLFFSVHKLTEEHYAEMFGAADVIAERIRAVGRRAPMDLGALLQESRMSAAEDDISAGEMCRSLAEDHEQIATRLHELVGLAEKYNDPVTADLATQRSAFHEQAVWMLKAISRD